MRRTTVTQLLAFLCLLLPAHAQIDTVAALSAFPLQEGNRWQYDVMVYPELGQPYSDGTSEIEVGPWMQQPNGRTYRELLGIDLFMGEIGDGSHCYVRLDSTRLAVQHYMGDWQAGGWCEADEEIRIDLATVSHMEHENCQGLVSSDCSASPVFGVDTPSISTSCLWYTSILSQGTGFSWFSIGDLGRVRLTLRAARIDGVDFGDWVSVAPPSVPRSARLSLRAWPNPFNPQARIRFELHQPADVDVSVYDLLGNRVVALARGPQASGWHEEVFDGAGLSSGVYFVSVAAAGRVETCKLLLVR